MFRLEFSGSVSDKHIAQQQLQYLTKFKGIKNLVIGCGREIEKGFTSEKLPNLNPCSMNRDHHDEILIDIDPRSKPDILMDFGFWENYDFHLLANQHFNRIDFEYLSNHPNRFSDIEIINWLKGADKLLARGGEVSFINAYNPYLDRAKKIMVNLLGYKLLNDGSTPAKFYDVNGIVIRDKNKKEGLHKYCLARKV